MSFRSLTLRRCALPLAAVLFVSACTEDGRETPLSGVEPIDIPAADVDNQQNQNISNPTLTIPETFKVGDGDLLTLVWSDEFDGAQLDPEVWFYETGDGSQYGIPGWGNNELQYYLPDNVQVADGKLQITARRETAEGYNFTSGRINTQDRFAFKYGRIEASIKFPSGQGLWPAFWMFSQDSPYGEWAATGEIDIVEAVNLDANPAPSGLGGGNEIFATIHFGGEFPGNTSAETRYTPSFDVTADFHTYAFEWDEFEMRWYVDGTLIKVENSWFSTAAPYPAPFDQPFYVLFNLAVGGNFPGSPDGTTPLPTALEVDWVRVYSGEDNYVPADPGTVPDNVIYATDPNVPVDIEFGVDYTGFEPFGSGSTFNGDNTSDRDFSPAFAVTTGDGYGAQVGQLGIVGFDVGFATGYESLQFKAKGLSNDLIRVKFNPNGGYLDVNLASSDYSTALGNGWYEVVIPIADFTGVDTADTLLFETDNASPNSFTFLLTDLGFNGSSGGGADPGIIPEDVIYATDPGETVDLVATVTAFGTSSAFDGAYALDADFNPSFQATSGSGYGLDNIVQLGFVDLGAGFASGYESFSFKIKSSDLPDNTIIVKLEQGGAYGNVVLTDTTVSTDLGNGWYQVVLPMSGFDNVDPAVGILFEAVGPQNADGGAPFSFLATDIGFNNPDGAGGGIIPEDVIYATDPGEVIDLVATITAFGTTSAFDGAYALDADFNPSFQATSGSGYGLDNIVQLGFVDLGAGFASGYGTFSFKIKSSDLPDNTIIVKLEQGGAYGNVVLTDTTVSTDLGNGWYQVVLPMSGFDNVDPAVGILFEAVGPQNADGGAPFSFLATDIGFSTGGGGGDDCTRPAVGPGVDLATNGDVETGDLTCWSLFDNGGTIQVSSPGADGSGFAVNADASGQPIGVTVKQANLGAGELTPGQTVRVSFDWRGTAALGGVVDIVLFSEVDGGGVSQTDPIQGGGVFPADWTTVGPLDITIGPDVSAGVTLQITAICGGDAGCEANLFIDNVSIVTP